MNKIIYTIGSTQKTAQQFFDKLHDNGVEILVDTRINSASQLAGFAKGEDLKYFLEKICGIKYLYRSDLAPTKELLKDYRNKKISWEEYVPSYEKIIESHGAYKNFLKEYEKYTKICLLCSEATPEKCHRRLLAEKIKLVHSDEIEVIHL